MFLGRKSFSVRILMGTKKSIFSQKTYYFQILGNDTLIINGYEDIEISILQQLAVGR